MTDHEIRTESLNLLSAELLSGKLIKVSVQTNSMSPTIIPGDMLTVSPASYDTIHNGDILLIKADDDWIVHRLMTFRKIRGQIHAVTRGDNSIYTDPPVLLTNILGKIINISRNNNLIIISNSQIKSNIEDVVFNLSFPSSNIPLNFTKKDIWNTMFLTADKEGLAPLIYYNNIQPVISNETDNHLESSTKELNAITSPFKKTYLTILAKNTLYLKTLHKLLLNLKDINIILLKGAYLASCIYKSPGLRSFSDIDILVKRDKFNTVANKLVQLGYKPLSSYPMPLSSTPYLNSITFRPYKTGPSIHIHWNIINSIMPKYTSTKIDMDVIWKDAQQTEDLFMAMSLEHLIIHLSEHALRHSFDRLVLLRDIAEVILTSKEEIDWDNLVNNSIQFNLAQPVFYTLSYLNRKLFVYVPPAILAKLHSNNIGLLGRLFIKMTIHGIRSPELCNLAYLDNRKSLREKIIFLWRIFVPPRSVFAVAYSKSENKIGVLDYILRLLRGLRYILLFITRIHKQNKEKGKLYVQ